MKPFLVLGMMVLGWSVCVAAQAAEPATEPAREPVVAEAVAKPALATAHQRPSVWEKLVAAVKDSALGDYFTSLGERLEQAAHLDQENELLRKKVAELQADRAKLEQADSERREQARASAMKHEAVAEGGVEASRTLASLKTADEHLLAKPPKAVFEQSLKAFADGDFETAAKALVFLADNGENDSFQTPQVFFLAGVSLYEVKNYKSALAYFARAQKDAGGDDLSYAPRALGWIALCHKKLGETAAEKKTVHELIQRYPKSKEARRLNGNA